MKKLFLLFIPFVMFFAAGCENNPAGALMYNGVNNSDPNSWANPFIIYSNGDLMTRVLPFAKAVGAYTDIWVRYANTINVLDLQYAGVSHSGHMSIRMGWDGSSGNLYQAGDGPMASGSPFTGAIFWLTTDPNDPSTGKDLTPGHYTQMTFWIKTQLFSNTVVQIVVLNNDAAGNSSYTPMANPITITQTQDWKQYTINLTPSPALTFTYITVKLIPDPSSGSSLTNGGTIYLDDIRLTR